MHDASFAGLGALRGGDHVGCPGLVYPGWIQVHPDALRQRDNPGDHVIRQAAMEAGMHSIGEDGLRKVLAGKTTLDEVGRVIYIAQHAGKVCPSCSSVLGHDFEYCPTCGEFVGEHCESCHRRLNPSWGYCPHCGEDTSHADHVAPAKPRRRRAAIVPEPMRKAS